LCKNLITRIGLLFIIADNSSLMKVQSATVAVVVAVVVAAVVAAATA
jgi:hypothetical protein